MSQPGAPDRPGQAASGGLDVVTGVNGHRPGQPGLTGRTNLEIDVSDAVDLPGTHVLHGWLRMPTATWPGPRTPLVYCLAGGRCTTAYFDLHVDGLDGWSMAEHLASRGAIVVALDHLGIGASSAVDDIFLVTPRMLAAIHARALGMVREMVDGDVLAVGLGHSMGGMLATVQQARHRCFDALVGLGHGGDGLPQFISDADRPAGDALHDHLRALARAHAERPPGRGRRLPPNSFFLPDVPAPVRAAFVAQQAELLHSCGMASLIPGATDTEKASIDIPLFLAFGDHDLTDDYLGNLARYRSVRDATLFVLRGSAHCHNQAMTRTVLWDRIASWLTSVGISLPG
ncbi:alpha/beta fold hydrolase [Pseudofrankia sp. BMG5.37]|uniref:alpha/beta hydrolase n=1 Tax=Pseudofrankia sp. BMG5.37 TaxID=3050035 RepID=UPI00289423ED|nr:alpha/beta fold hydrolase [Pseudofrankia sp. BMG5.37]MDT3440204.1 alpha/beta fold hydrolase [Pseudofrankia sp. BMG5.37]